MKTLKFILLWIWQLPQNIAGLIFYLIMNEGKNIKLDNGNIACFSNKMSGGISLGNYSVIDGYYWKYNKGDINKILNLNVTKHEGYGHAAQSRLLGPLYLLIIGLPSIIWASLYGTKLFPYKVNGYYVFYTEKWADKEAGIIRN